MAVQSIHNLEKEIHSSHDVSLFSNNHYANRIAALVSEYSISEHFHVYAKTIRELNKKHNEFNLSSKIISPVDAGFKPINLSNFLSLSNSPGVPDNLLAENYNTLVQENGFNIVLEQDV
jgi:hypothetical protein